MHQYQIFDVVISVVPYSNIELHQNDTVTVSILTPICVIQNTVLSYVITCEKISKFALWKLRYFKILLINNLQNWWSVENGRGEVFYVTKTKYSPAAFRSIVVFRNTMDWNSARWTMAGDRVKQLVQIPTFIFLNVIIEVGYAIVNGCLLKNVIPSENCHIF